MMQKIKALDIIPECYIDTNLVETLLQIGTGKEHAVNHQKGCNNVACTMRKNDGFAVGVVDTDKKQPSYWGEFVLIKDSQHLSLKKHESLPQYVIFINPAIERFLLDCAKEAELDLQDYGLPSNFDEFRHLTKDVDSKRETKFKNLFKALQNHKEMQILASVLTYLHCEGYKAETKYLSEIFQGKI